MLAFGALRQALSIFTRWRTLRSMPASTGDSSCSALLPMRPSPSARRVPRWRWDCPIALRVWRQPQPRHRLGHLLGLPRQHLADALAARLGDVLGPTQVAAAPRPAAFSHVDRIGRAERLREHVADTAELEHGADAAAGDDAGSRRGRTQQHARRAELAEHLVGDRLAVLGDREQVLLRVVDGLRDRERNLARLPVADADAVDLVADTTSAVNEKRRPPLTTLATRLISTTRSLSSPVSVYSIQLKTSVLLRARRLRAP